MSQWSLENTQASVSAWNNPSARRRRRKWFYWLGIAAVIAAVAVALFAARPAYRKFRDWRLDQQVEEAKEAYARGDRHAARARAKAVLIARGNDFEAFRIYVKSQIDLKEQASFPQALALLSHPKSTAEEKTAARRFLIDEAPQAIAFSVLLSLPEEERTEPQNLAFLARLLNGRGRHAEVLGLLEQHGENIDGHPPAVLETVRALAGLPSPDNIRRARGLMLGLLDSAPSLGLEALALLGNFAGALEPGPDLAGLVEKIDGIPEAEAIHHLLALHSVLGASVGDDAARAEIFDLAVRRFRESDPGTLGSWLVRHGEAKRAVELLEEPAKTDGGAFTAYIHALIREDRMDEALRAFHNVPEGADMLEIDLARAIVERTRGSESAERAAWNRALHNATFGSTRNRFIEVARYASAMQVEAATVDAWVGAMRIGYGPLPLSEDLQFVFAALARDNRTEELLAVSRAIARYEPKNPLLLNNINYLGLLHGVIPPGSAEEALAELAEEYPQVEGIRSSLAMARLAGGRAEETLEILAGIGVDGGGSRLAMRGAALVSAGNEEEGRAVLAGVDWNGMLRQEALFLRGLLVRSQVRDLPLPEINMDLFEEDSESVPAWKKALRALEEGREAGEPLLLPEEQR